MVPYSTVDVDASSVVQVMVAEFTVALEATEEILGAVESTTTDAFNDADTFPCASLAQA